MYLSFLFSLLIDAELNNFFLIEFSTNYPFCMWYFTFYFQK